MTLRALLVGLAMAVWVNLWPTYSSLIAHSSRADYAHLSVALLIPFICLLGLNLPFHRRGRGLSASELLAICCIGMVAATMQGEWLSGYLLGVVTAPTYFATPENQWADHLLARIPTWTVVADPAATTGFYESLFKGQKFPWSAWAAPFFWWAGFLGSVLTVSFCLVVILRKQWMDNERLNFPIATAVLELTGVSGSERSLSTLVRSRLFRFGFWLIVAIFCWNIATWFVRAIPVLDVPMTVLSRKVIRIGQGFPYFAFSIHPMTIAFAYFTESSVLFSIWLFHLLAILQVGVFNRLGFSIGGSDMWCSFDPAIGWQSFGGLTVFAGWGLWVARSHLAAVFRKAFARTADANHAEGSGHVDDSNELISYRTAVYMLLAGCAYLLVWLFRAGMAAGPLLAFWFATLVLYLGLARIIVESGLVYLRGPITAQAFTWHLFGISGMGAHSAVALGLTYTFFCDAKTWAVTALAHVPRLGMAMRPERRRLLAPGVLMGALAGALSVIGFILYHGNYGVGSYNFGVVSFNGSGDGAVGIWRYTAARIQEGTAGTSWDRVGFFAIGAAFTGILVFLRYRFPGFPVHPIGFTISASNVLRSSVTSIFIAWLTKALILRFGGLNSYRRMAPLFLGMFMGYLAGVGLGVVADVVWFNGDGHKLNDW